MGRICSLFYSEQLRIIATTKPLGGIPFPMVCNVLPPSQTPTHVSKPSSGVRLPQAELIPLLNGITVC